MAETLSPRRGRRRWIIPLALLVSAGLLLGDVYLLKPAIEQLSWKIASRRFDGWDMVATSEDNIILVGSDILHYNGLYWRRAAFPLRLAAGERLGQPEAWQKEHGIEWPTLQDCAPYLETVCAYDKDHIYAGGAAGILRYNGLFWRQMPVAQGLEPNPCELWAQNPDSVYGLDHELGVLYWDGQIWDVLPLPVEGVFRAKAVGGTAENAVIIGERALEGQQSQVLLVQEDGTWTLADTLALVEGIEPSSVQSWMPDRMSYGPLEFGNVWGQDDGRTIVSVTEETRGNGPDYLSYRRLLCHDQGTWSFVEAPFRWLHCTFQSTITRLWTDSQGYLGAMTNHGFLMGQIKDGSRGICWDYVDSPSRFSGGIQELLPDGKLLVYGGYLVSESWENELVSQNPCALNVYDLPR